MPQSGTRRVKGPWPHAWCESAASGDMGRCSDTAARGARLLSRRGFRLSSTTLFGYRDGRSGAVNLDDPSFHRLTVASILRRTALRRGRILSTRRSFVVSLTLALLMANASTATGPADDGPFDGRVPQGQSAAAWSGIRAAYETKRHEAFAVEGGWRARNLGQQWRTRFDRRGFLTTPDGGGWSWGLEFVSYGCANDPRRAREQACSIREPAFLSRDHGEAAPLRSRHGEPG